MRFAPIPPESFAAFHQSFHGQFDQTFRVCEHCEGACERSKVGSLMPGEREFMAAEMDISSDEFSAHFLDVIVVDGMEIDVLRMVDRCPFLHPVSFECGCREYKVVLCDTYPIGFHVANGMVQFDIDPWCPIADTRSFREHFLNVGVPAIAKLPVPIGWYECVARYDDLYFDYDAVLKYRRNRFKHQMFTLEELLPLQCSGEECAPKRRLHPYPEEVVSHWSASTIFQPRTERLVVLR